MIEVDPVRAERVSPRCSVASLSFFFFEETRQAQSTMTLEELPVTLETYPANQFVTKLLKNKIFRIPREIMPQMRTYEIQVEQLHFVLWRGFDLNEISADVLGFARMSIDQSSIDSTGGSDRRMCGRANRSHDQRCPTKSKFSIVSGRDRQIQTPRGSSRSTTTRRSPPLVSVGFAE